MDDDGEQCGHCVGGAGEGVVVSAADGDDPNDAEEEMDGDDDMDDVAVVFDVDVCDGDLAALGVLVGEASGNAPAH